MPTPRPITGDDLQSTGELLNNIFRLPRGITNQQMLTDYPLVFTPSNYHNCRIIIEDGQIVSHAAIWPRELIVNGEQFKVAVLVAVATHPEYRKRGLAAKIVEDLQRSLHDENYDLAILWTGVPDFYSKLGWQTVVPQGQCVTVEPRQFKTQSKHNYEICQFNIDEHLDTVVELHDREAVRFARSNNEFRELLNLPELDVWLAKKNSQIAAYLIHANSCNKQGIAEYGGNSAGIVSLIEYVAGRCQNQSAIPLNVYHPYADLCEWATSTGLSTKPLPSSKGSGTEMIYLVNPDKVSQHVCDQLFVWGLDQA